MGKHDVPPVFETTAKPPTREQRIQDYHNKFVEARQAGRADMLWNAYENVLFYLRYQWITRDNTIRDFRSQNMKPTTPRPVVNIFKAKMKKVIALIAAVEPALITAPGTDTEIDRLTADSAVDVIKYLEKVVRLDRLRLRLATAVGLTNNAFTVVGYDSVGGKNEKVPKWECENGHACSADEAQSNALLCQDKACVEKDVPLSPSTTQFDEISEGIVTAAVATVFESWLDWTIQDQEDLPAFMWRRMRPLEWIYERAPQLRGKVPEETSPADLGLMFLQNIVRLAPSLRGQFVGGRFTNSAVVDDLYVKPCKEFPKGLWARTLADGQIIDAKPLPFHDGTSIERGAPIIPVQHFGFDEVPGTMLCVGPADDMKPLQRERNRMLASIAMYCARSGNSYMYLPQGIDIEKLTGVEGQVLRGMTTATGGGEPKRVEAAQMSAAYTQRIEQIDYEFDQIISIREFGDEAPRIDSGYAMQQLEERKLQNHNPLFKKFEQGYAGFARHLFFVFRNFAPEKIYYRIKGEEARWTVRCIREADLRGGVDIDMEPGSAQPRTPLQKRAMYEQAVAMKIVDPLNDPKAKLAYARLYGVRELMATFDSDMRKIAREHDAVKRWAAEHFDMTTGEPLPGDTKPEESWPVFVNPNVDNSPLHWAEHRVWMQSEEYEALPESVRELFDIAHYQPTCMLVGMAAQAGGQPGEEGGGGPGGAGASESNAQAGAAAQQSGGGSNGREERRDSA